MRQFLWVPLATILVWNVFSCGTSKSDNNIVKDTDDGGSILSDGSPNVVDANLADASGDGALIDKDGSVGPGPGDTNVSGSRLKMRSYVGADGSKQFFGWKDTQLGVDCSFGKASDGQIRCLPASANVIGYFSDAGCVQPLAYVAKGCTSPTTVLEYLPGSGNCAVPTTRIRTIVAAYPSGGAYSGKPGSCPAVAAASVDALRVTYDFYTSGAEVAPSTYVSAIEQ